MSAPSWFLLLGEASSAEAAAKVARMFAPCPYVYFMAAFGNFLVGVFPLPAERRWWIERIVRDPQGTLGLARVALYETNQAAYPEEPRSVLGDQRGEISPCGADCAQCPHYVGLCRGCPGTFHFRGR